MAGYLATAVLSGAEVSGKWMVDESGSGNPITMNLEVDDDGTTVTGTVTGPQGEVDITDGRIDDDEISFSVVSEYDGEQITQNYRGTVEDDLIHFRLTVEGGGFRGGHVREFEAKRVSPGG